MKTNYETTCDVRFRLVRHRDACVHLQAARKPYGRVRRGYSIIAFPKIDKTSRFDSVPFLFLFGIINRSITLLVQTDESFRKKNNAR